MCARQITGHAGRGASGGQHAGGLRVVEDHDVARPDHLRSSAARVGRAPALVDGALRLAQRPAVAGDAVEAVVQALGDAEELRRRPSMTTQRASIPAPRT